MVRNMKKTALFAGLVLLLATACHKADVDAFGGHSDDGDNPVHAYMLTLADDIVAESLEELEAALQMNPQDQVAQALYVIQGDLSHVTGTWTIRRECPLKGLVIRCNIHTEGLTGWILEYDGALDLSGYTYPTRFTVEAERTSTQETHTDWRITKFSGHRIEQEGYKCTFDISSGLLYEALPESNLWNAYGTIHMDVYKNDTLVDTAYLSLKGAPSASIFVHGV